MTNGLTDLESSAWIRRYHPSRVSTVRLVCFPHASGSASYFYPVSRKFSPAVDVIALQYPGRQYRRHELCIPNTDVLAGKITAQLLSLNGKPTVLFGHSMGATLAFEVAWRLENAGIDTPLRVIASGRRGPAILREEKVHLRNDVGICEEIRRLNGTGSAVLDDEEILQAALPAIRGDYEAIEMYSHVPGRKLSCPVTALTGTPIRPPPSTKPVNGARSPRDRSASKYFLVAIFIWPITLCRQR